jgi:hypothetical protein
MTANPAQTSAPNGSEMYRGFSGTLPQCPSAISYHFYGTWHTKEQTAATAGNGEWKNKALVTHKHNNKNT